MKKPLGRALRGWGWGCGWGILSAISNIRDNDQVSLLALKMKRDSLVASASCEGGADEV